MITLSLYRFECADALVLSRSGMRKNTLINSTVGMYVDALLLILKVLHDIGILYSTTIPRVYGT